MIILEGPDGGGKTTLAAQLADIHRIEVRKRDHQDAYLWAMAEMTGWEKDSLMVYDRFPLIGEYIYGPIRRGLLAVEFGAFRRSTAMLLNRFLQDSLIIYCRPPLSTISDNVMKTGQPADIMAKVHAIVEAYDAHFTLVPHVIYDYTDTPPDYLSPIVSAHRREWEKRSHDNS